MAVENSESRTNPDSAPAAPASPAEDGQDGALERRASGPPEGEEEAVPAVEQEPDDPIAAWTCTPYAVAFLTAVCMMVVEMLASRMIARQVGSSLYTWTSVIGVVLAGVSIGSFVSGRLADRYRPERFLGWLFLMSSVSCVVTLFLNYYFVAKRPLEGMTWPPLVFLTVLALFLVPSLLLGSFGPPAAKMALRRSTRIGFTLGSVSAWGAAGSIVGTVAAGFWLISFMGTKSLMLTAAWVLAAAGLALGPWRTVHCMWVVAVTVALIISRDASSPTMTYKFQQVLQEARGDLFAGDSKYQYVRVYEDDSKRDKDRSLRVLALDFLIHGYIDKDDPSYLEYLYERVYRDVVLRYAGEKKTVGALFLGGGSFTFPRWTLSQWPDANIVVAEIDPMVVEANHKAMGLPRDTPIHIMTMDARIAVDSLPEDALFDFALGDAFNDLSSPYHLCTVEFDRKIKKHLKPEGAYLVNVIDSYKSGLLVGALTATLRKVFRYTYVFCTEKSGVSTGRDTFVIVASDVPLDTTGWHAGHSTEFAGSLLTDENMNELLSRCNSRVLTDDDAPVENLIAPVLRMRTQN